VLIHIHSFLLEFTQLFRYIQAMRASFESFDRNRDQVLDVNEATAALHQAGYKFQNAAPFVARFNRRGTGLTFENFMELAIFLGNWKTLFTLHDADRDGWVTLNLEEFILLDTFVFRT
jgi:Ca2+-binding EF-hand superfamily protein